MFSTLASSVTSDSNRDCSVRGVFREVVAVFRSGAGAILVDISNDHSPRAGFGKGESCLFANTAGTL